MDPVIGLLCLLGIIVLIFLIPLKGAGSFAYQAPSKRMHEEDAVLSRRLLKPGSRDYELYYSHRPEFKQIDDRSREAPGLLDQSSRYFEAGTFAAANANFQVVDYLGALVYKPGPVKDRPGNALNPQKVSAFIQSWMIQTGAHSVGFTELKEYHLYSFKGRGPRKGQTIEKNQGSAIALTVEMDHRMMQSAPLGTSVMESSEQYLRSGVLALKLAAWIREQGYEATAHIDGNYEVICPLVAVDAGLGVLGRMGLLMTPKLGPRVRIAVVTTSLPMEYSTARPEKTTLHFCHHCKKCASVCPSAAIPTGPQEEVDGNRRWKIDSEKCYHFWTTSGTDCGRCISVCPFSHRDNLFHRIIRAGIKNNLLFRYLAIKLDDVFYGRKPPVRPLPEWADLMKKP